MTGSAAASSVLVDIAGSTGFAGVVRLERPGEPMIEFAAGLADRRNGVPVELATRFGVASGTKGFTALTVVSLVESGELALDTTIRSVVGDALSRVDDGVTIEHLLGHTSGVGDYLDEEVLGDIDDYIFTVSPHVLARPTDYLDLVNAQPQVSSPGERFTYNNGGYVMLSIVIETITGSFHDAVRDRVLEPAEMNRAGFFRGDDLPPETAVGYLENGRTNVYHLPVVGAGDGGIYLSLDDVSAFWDALERGCVVSTEHVEEMTTVRRIVGDDAYGLGFWLSPDGQIVALEGQDAGVSFRSAVNRTTHSRYTVMSNSSTGAWPLAKALEPLIAEV